MPEFKINRNEHDNIERCECCSLEVETAKFENKFLCEYCSSSYVYSPLSPNYELKQIMAQMFNTLEERLKRLTPSGGG